MTDLNEIIEMAVPKHGEPSLDIVRACRDRDPSQASTHRVTAEFATFRVGKKDGSALHSKTFEPLRRSI